jgi:REP element-mobilizing transposase RayT
MILSKNGEIVRDELLKTPNIRREIELDVYAVMPNHLHVIVWITECSGDRSVARPGDARVARVKENSLKPVSVGAFVAGFKSGITKRINAIRQMPGVPVWQRNYYEHVIRNEDELKEI